MNLKIELAQSPADKAEAVAVNLIRDTLATVLENEEVDFSEIGVAENEREFVWQKAVEALHVVQDNLQVELDDKLD